MIRFGLGLFSAVFASLPAIAWSQSAPPSSTSPQDSTSPQPSLSPPPLGSSSPTSPALRPTGKLADQAISGQTVIVNGVRVSIPWTQWQADGKLILGISDVGLRQFSGLDLLNTDQPDRQPISWRSGPLQENGQFLELPAYLTAQHRYLDLQPLIDEAGWQVTVEGKTLESRTLRIQIQSISPISNLLLGRSPAKSFGPLDIAWAQGIRWQQAYVRVGGAEFPVTQLRLDLQQAGLELRPVWPKGEGLIGIARLDETLTTRGAIAGINAGYFNRNNKAPLAALRSRGEWISGPILDRGVIGWNEAGQVVIDRLTLTETLQPVPSAGQEPSNLPGESFESIALNSGYLKAGFSRYTTAWGPTYTPLTDNEVLIYVQEGRVIEQRFSGKAGTESFPLSLPGQASGGSDLKNYLLVARSSRTGAAKLPVGTVLELSQRWSSPGLARSPNLLGAGPLLIQNHRIVLDAAAEGFSSAFIREQAPRSVAAVFADGSLSLITVHERVGGKGPTLAELARLLQSMDAVQALNLDGGSSTQLFLGGQLINRSPRSAARVHSGMGLFLKRP